MEKQAGMSYASSFRDQFTWRAVILGAIGSAIITTSSMYVALRMGALPWPTIFVAILSLTVLKALGRTNLNEINVTHTAMSAGGMVAGGVAFTIPGIWMLDKNAAVGLWPLLTVALAGTVLGVILVASIRRHFIEVEELPFPMGIAAAETVLAGDEGGQKAKWLFGSLGAAALLTALRDQWQRIPGAWTPPALWSRNIQFGLWVSPMAVGIGYLIGPFFTGTWFLGAALSYLLFIPLAVNGGYLSMEAATALKNSLGIGLIVGAGVGVLLKGVLPRAREIFGPLLGGKGDINLRWAPLTVAAIIFLLTTVAGIGFLPTLVTVLGVWVTTAMAATLDGQTGIDPMEIFGILVLLAVKLFWQPDATAAFFVAAVVAVACGLAGDNLQDFKSGYILKTQPRAQVYAELIGGVVGALVAVVVLFVMHRAYGAMGPGTELVAPQAYAVSTMVSGLPNPPAFLVGLVAGAVLYFLGVPGMTIGIGIYLPMFISTTAALGGLARWVVDKRWPGWNERGQLISSGFLGGEGVTGVVIALVRVFTGA
ncbi:OPT/YSL family transporter [Gelria sp. Kuro-4]|uniref:OPT/YSL family transporter n=1 Tax=Gelria sp. Kuro-4 TaxID=2796927 RepID=UPI001BEFEBCB|nr:OPT/YSL family transporter [Gelria sp. Kuro-4]BCV23569.1 oligopeptide transporter, OPT family [Gelria sp. Kuro-4]